MDRVLLSCRASHAALGVFAIEQGAELVGGTPASSRIVGFSIPGNESYAASDMTDDGWAFFESAIRWLDAVD